MIGRRGSIGQPVESQGGKVLQKKDGNMRPPAEEERAEGRKYAPSGRRGEGAGGRCYMRCDEISRRKC